MFLLCRNKETYLAKLKSLNAKKARGKIFLFIIISARVLFVG